MTRRREIRNTILSFMSENNLLPDAEDDGPSVSSDDAEGFDELNAEFAKIMGTSSR